MSCNGCRVLRKGCSDDCTIRPCLDWIKNPESQGNATVFLSKFYGRAGLLNLIAAGPDHLRPAIFRSLLYEASGRMVNPIYGPVGLLWSGNWHLCQAAVEAVLSGKPIHSIQSNDSNEIPASPLKSFNIRHVAKANITDLKLHKVHNTSRTRFKRPTKNNSCESPKSTPVNVPKRELLASLVADQNVLSLGSTAMALELTLGSSVLNSEFGK